MPRLPTDKADPRHRYHAIADRTRAPVNAYEIALLSLLEPTAKLPARPEPEVVKSVQAACMSFQTDRVRALFDACLLAEATSEELSETFNVERGEYAAYETLFFDRSVFKNDFHVIAYIAAEPDEMARELLRDAFSKGFRALKFKYASAAEAMSPQEAMQYMLEEDLQLYRAYRATPPTAKTSAGVRALGKQVLATAQALGKTAAQAPAGDEDSAPRDEDAQFVLDNGPTNPTLEELLAAGGKLAH